MMADPLILQMKYADIIKLFSKKIGLSLDESLKVFYHSQLYQLLKDGVSDMHCMSEAYLVEDLENEYRSTHSQTQEQ